MGKKTFCIILSLLMLGFLKIPCRAFESGSASYNKEYVVSSDDILEVAVYGEPDLSAISRVSQDGTINYPLLGNIMAAGLTVRELERNITELLGEDYLVSPQVSIFIKEYAKISILGAVRQSGAYEAKQKLTLTQAIALAGGFSEEANITNVKITRVTSSGKETVVVDVSRISEKAAEDMEIKSGDTIMVEEYGRFSVMGQVNKPGIYKLKKDLTVTEAIIIAGGFTPTAAPNGTKVVREKNGKKTVINVPAANIAKGGESSGGVLLEQGDTVIVPESFF
jgi:polysaccharide biosynthesis/export protein